MQGRSPKLNLVGFRRLSQEEKPEMQFRRFSLEQTLINVVLIEIGGTETEKNKLYECENWMRTEPKIRLWKVLKEEAFYQTYLELMKQSLPVYFISLASLERLHEEPLLNAYKITLEAPTGSLAEVFELARDNLQRIHFIILKDNIENLHRQNYFHAGVTLITSEPSLVIQELVNVLKLDVDLREMPSSSSINTEDVEQFARKIETKIGGGVKIASPEKVAQVDPQTTAWKMKNHTPGVGTYELSNSHGLNNSR